MGSYRDLDVWKISMDLVEKIYAATKDFPKEEIYGVTSQIRRASLSIPANIAEGSARNSSNDFSRFISIAYGSCCELETLIQLCLRLDYIKKETADEIEQLLGSVSRMLKALRQSLQKERIAA